MKNFILRIFQYIDKKTNLKEKITSGNITRNIIIAYIILVFIPVSIIMYYYYRKSASIVEHEVTQAMMKSLTQAEVNISYRFKNIQDVSNNIFMDQTLNQQISSDLSNQPLSKKLEEFDRTSKIIYNYQNNEDIFKIRLFIKQNKLYTNEHINFFNYSELNGVYWSERLEKLNGAIYWKGTYSQSYIDIGNSENVITCARIIKNLKNLDQIIGAVLIDIKEEKIYDILNDSQVSNKESIFLIDENGNIVAHSDKSLLGTKYSYEGEFESAADIKEGIYKIKSEYLICKNIELLNWKIISLASVNEIFVKGKIFNNFFNVFVIVAVFIVFMIAFFVMFWYLVLRMNRRIKTIINAIEVEGIENLDMDSLTSNEEVYKLESKINGMVQRVKDLMEKAYQAEVEKKESELKILQAQINPHFLYNTLDNISWMAIKINAKDISLMIQLLSKYFRLSLNSGRDIVSIKDEINLAKVYLDMQNSRFLNIITVTFDVDDAVLQYNIPKLTLQPIIENAVLHGLQYKDDKDWQILISAKLIGDEIVFIIKDNGIGIEDNALKRLLVEPKTEKERFSYGLYNVNKRLQLFFGEGYGINITTVPNRGTTVTVNIQAIIKD